MSNQTTTATGGAYYPPEWQIRDAKIAQAMGWLEVPGGWWRAPRYGAVTCECPRFHEDDKPFGMLWDWLRGWGVDIVVYDTPDRGTSCHLESREDPQTGEYREVDCVGVGRFCALARAAEAAIDAGWFSDKDVKRD